MLSSSLTPLTPLLRYQPHLLSSSEIKFETEQSSRPMLKPGANLEMLVAGCSLEEEEEEESKVQLLEDRQESSIESSRSVTPDV